MTGHIKGELFLGDQPLDTGSQVRATYTGARWSTMNGWRDRTPLLSETPIFEQLMKEMGFDPAEADVFPALNNHTEEDANLDVFGGIPQETGTGNRNDSNTWTPPGPLIPRQGGKHARRQVDAPGVEQFVDVVVQQEPGIFRVGSHVVSLSTANPSGRHPSPAGGNPEWTEPPAPASTAHLLGNLGFCGISGTR